MLHIFLLLFFLLHRSLFLLSPSARVAPFELNKRDHKSRSPLCPSDDNDDDDDESDDYDDDNVENDDDDDESDDYDDGNVENDDDDDDDGINDDP